MVFASIAGTEIMVRETKKQETDNKVSKPFFFMIPLLYNLFAFARIPCSLSEQSGDPACGAAGSFIGID